MKKVSFGHVIIFYFSDEDCRLPYWEVVARDNERFKNRIARCGAIINPVLTCQHRNAWLKKHVHNIGVGEF